MIHCDGPTFGRLLGTHEPRMTLFTGSSRVAEALATQLRGKVKLEDAGFDWKVLGPDVPPDALTREAYQALEKPSEREPVRHYGHTMAGLYDAILNLCVEPTKMCMRDMMRLDAQGGTGLNNVYNVARLRYDQARPMTRGDEESYVLALCQIEPDRLQGAAPDAPRYSPLP